MSHIPEQINKINTNIVEAESILLDLKRRPKTENVAEQIEHFESMLNKLNSLKESYMQLSSQFDAANDLKKSLTISTVSQNNNTDLSGLDLVNGSVGISSNACSLTSLEDLEKLKQERDRLKRLLQERGIKSKSLEIDVRNDLRQSPNSPNIVNNLNDTELETSSGSYSELSFYISILSHHIDIGSKMIDMVEGVVLNENVQQGINLLKDVMQRLLELRERFQCVQNAKECIENQEDVNSEIIQQEMETFSTISEDLKMNFSTGVKCFKSAMDIIHAYLESNSTQQPESNGDGTDGEENELRTSLRDDNFCTFSNDMGESRNDNKSIYPGKFSSIEKKSKNNNNSDSSSERNNPDDDEANNDAEDEDSNGSCHEKDQDESMEIGVITNNTDTSSNLLDHDAMNQLRMQTEIEQQEILRLLEEKRIMQQKLAELKRAKELAQKQINFVQNGNIYEDLSGLLRICQDNERENSSHSQSSIVQRPESLDLKAGNMVNEMGSLLKLLSDIKVDVDNESSIPPHKSNRSANSSFSKNGKDSNSTCHRVVYNNNESPNNPRSYAHSTLLMPEISIKNEELQQQNEILQQSQSRIQQLQEILNRIKKDSINMDDSLINETEEQYLEEQNNDREISNNGRPAKGRDSVTFQEPVATFIANDELYENMREVRMRREELRDLSARNSNSDPRSPAGRVMDSGNAPGAPPEVPTRIPVTNHDTASQDRTTAATWGSSSGGGDDYEEPVPNNSIQNETIRIRSTGNRVSPLSNVNDEGSRVAPIGQSSTFRSKTKDSSYIKNVIDTDFANLKSQIENIATMCRNMALEQNRLARDISEIKRGSSPRINNNGPDLVINPSTASNIQKHAPHTPSLLTDDNLQNWSSPINSGVPLTNMSSSVRNGNCLTTADSSINFCGGIRPVVQIDSNWDEASISSSNAIQLNKQPAFYYSPTNNYQNILNQQNMLLQSHSMFMRLQMSLIASQLEQQRMMCNVSMQPNNCPYTQYPPWPMRGIAPPFYPPPGPLPLPSWNMLQPNTDLITGSQHSNFNDPDYLLYTSSYPSESRETVNTSNPNSTSNMNFNSWKNGSSNRNIHRN